MGVQRSRTTGTGRGLAIAGIIIGVLSLIAAGVGTTITVLTFRTGAKAIQQAAVAVMAPRTTVMNYLTDLSKNDVDTALTETSSISKEAATDQAKLVQSYGGFKDMSNPNVSIASSTVNTSAGAHQSSTATFTGTATFGVGNKSVQAELTNDGSKWRITWIKIE
jgi:hypothetical protein